MLTELDLRRVAIAGAFDDLRRDTICEDGVDHYAVAMRDPEGIEFDIN